MQEPAEKKKKVKRVMTEKQKAARLANLARGRKKRLENIQQKKEVKPTEEYDLSSQSDSETDSDVSSDNDAFIISKAKKAKRAKTKEPPVKEKKTRFVVGKEKRREIDDGLRTDVDELKFMVMELAELQKKQNKKTRKQTEKKSGGTKIVVLPQSNNNNTTKPPHGDLMEALRKSLM